MLDRLLPVLLAETEVAPAPQMPTPSLKQLLNEVAADYKLTPEALSANGRTRYSTWARHEFCYRALNETLKASTQIGRTINRDHSTVLYGCVAHCYRNGLPFPRGMAGDYKLKRRFSKP